MTQRGHAWKLWEIFKVGRRGKVRRNVKDRLFRFLFEKDREALLELYNALNGTDYKDSSKLEIVTIESAVYVVMKNDLAFILTGTLNIPTPKCVAFYNGTGEMPEEQIIRLSDAFEDKAANADVALAEAVDYCIENGILEKVLRENRAEVLVCCWKSLT